MRSLISDVYFQMALLRRLTDDDKYRAWEIYASMISGFTLCDKFGIVTVSLRAEPLGWCGLRPGVEYRVVVFERQSPQTVFVHYEDQFAHVTDPLRSFRLPPRYARMVSKIDAVIVNWGYRKYNILRKKKPVDMVTRVHLYYKDYTWDLVLREVCRCRPASLYI
jgi:hypothetical protein